jgi:hypothetical protein
MIDTTFSVDIHDNNMMAKTDDHSCSSKIFDDLTISGPYLSDTASKRDELASTPAACVAAAGAWRTHHVDLKPVIGLEGLDLSGGVLHGIAWANTAHCGCSIL